MVDETRVLRLLRLVADDVAVLTVEQAADASRRADPMWLRGVKYSLVTAVEACIDVAQHLCASEGWRSPTDNGDAMTVLGEHGVLTPPLSDVLRQAVGFRNVLVHEYVVVDDRIVLARLGDLSDLTRFVQQVTGWLSAPPG